MKKVLSMIVAFLVPFACYAVDLPLSIHQERALDSRNVGTQHKVVVVYVAQTKVVQERYSYSSSFNHKAAYEYPVQYSVQYPTLVPAPRVALQRPRSGIVTMPPFDWKEYDGFRPDNFVAGWW